MGIAGFSKKLSSIRMCSRPSVLAQMPAMVSPQNHHRFALLMQISAVTGDPHFVNQPFPVRRDLIVKIRIGPAADVILNRPDTPVKMSGLTNICQNPFSLRSGT